MTTTVRGNDKIFAKRTYTRELKTFYRQVLSVKLISYSGQSAHLVFDYREEVKSIGGEWMYAENNWKRDIYDFLRFYPELKELHQWDGAHVKKAQWYYMQNGLFHAGKCLAWPSKTEYYPANPESFARTINLGALSDDPTDAELLVMMDKKDLKEWMAIRRPLVVDSFHAALIQYFGTEPVMEAINAVSPNEPLNT